MNDKKNREPMVIALATGKGGSMKTTSAVFLACALVDQSRGEQHVLVVDADVQGDAKDWWYRADELGDPLPFDVMSAAPADITHLRGINDRLDDPVDWVLIDSAPYGRALDESVNNADLVVIPSSPSRIDLDQAVGVKNLCDRRGVPSAILLCRTEANTTALRDALEWIDAAGIACFETLIPKRQDILNAKSTRPRGSRLHEYRGSGRRRTQADHATAQGQGGGPVRNMNLTPRPRDLTALLNSDRTDTAIPNTEKTKNRKDEKPESGEGWVKTSVSLRASTRRRLKTWAAAHDMRIQEVLEDALDSYLS